MQAIVSAGVLPRRLKKRSQFLRAARGKRAGRAGFSLQAVSTSDDAPGVGFTVTKKTGNSPERNRIKRRLREAVRSCAGAFQSSHDYVIVARREALYLPFPTIVRDLASLIGRVGSEPAKLDLAGPDKA